MKLSSESVAWVLKLKKSNSLRFMIWTLPKKRGSFKITEIFFARRNFRSSKHDATDLSDAIQLSNEQFGFAGCLLGKNAGDEHATIPSSAGIVS